MRINKVAHASIATDQDKLFECRALPASFEQPEEAFDRHIHNRLRRLLGSSQVQYMGNAGQGVRHHRRLINRAAHHFQSFMRWQRATVAKRTHRKMIESRISQQTPNKNLAHFARCASHEDAFCLSHSKVPFTHAKIFIL